MHTPLSAKSLRKNDKTIKMRVNSFLLSSEAYAGWKLVAITHDGQWVYVTLSSPQTEEGGESRDLTASARAIVRKAIPEAMLFGAHQRSRDRYEVVLQR